MIDNTLLYKGFNSYELDVGEALRGTTLNVALYSHISLQVVAIKLSGTATGKFNVRWLDAGDERIGAAVEVDFNVGNKWSRKTATLEAPEGAEKAEVALANSGDTKFHISCPMAEAGEIATGYDPSLADKVSWHDATGSYVGFLRADQIVAGVLRSIVGDSGFDLEAPEIWMKSTDGEITWKASPENPFELTDGDGKVLGGMAYIDNVLRIIADSLTNDPESGRYATVGTWEMPEFQIDEYFNLVLPPRTLTGVMMFSDSYSKSVPLIAFGATEESVNDPFGPEYTEMSGDWYELHVKGKVVMVANSEQVFFKQGNTNVLFGEIESEAIYGFNATVDEYDGECVPSLEISTHMPSAGEPNGLAEISSGAAGVFMHTNEYYGNEVEMRRHGYWDESSDYSIGIDEDGPYYEKDWDRSYLGTQTQTGGQDFDDYTTQGTWFIPDSSYHDNQPQGTSGGILRVTTDGSFVMQEYLTYNNSWQRRRLGNGTWNAWFSIKG